MRVSVIGCSTLGAAQAVALASMGHDVVGVDCDAAVVAALTAGRADGAESGLVEALAEMLATGRLRFTTDLAAIIGARVHFICVDAPLDRGSFAGDLAFTEVAADAMRPHLAHGDVVASRSTVPQGSAERFVAHLDGTGATYVRKSLDVRAGFELENLLRPERLVYGVPAGTPGETATAVLDRVFAALLSDGVPRVVTDYATATRTAPVPVPTGDPVETFLRAVELNNVEARELLLGLVPDVHNAAHDQLVATWAAYRDGAQRPLAHA
jgi:UDPglucose 6-dehydrogenase